MEVSVFVLFLFAGSFWGFACLFFIGMAKFNSTQPNVKARVVAPEQLTELQEWDKRFAELYTAEEEHINSHTNARTNMTIGERVG